jgi:hypothetical protein
MVCNLTRTSNRSLSQPFPMNPQSIFVHIQPNCKLGMNGGFALEHRNEVRWTHSTKYPPATRTAGFVIG